MRTALEILAEEASACTKCKLAGLGRTQVVFSRGDPDAELMFVGEGPGAEEDKQGLPFVGRSGQLLDRLIVEELGLRPDQVYVGNVVKCLRYTAMVQLGDGSWERIGQLVRDRYAGTVMTVDASGRLAQRRVIGWHTSPLAGRRVFRLTYRSAKRAGNGKVSIELTGDHEVMTDRGWIAVQDLPPMAKVATGQGLTDLAFDVVCGTLLGDGHLNASGSHLSFAHSTRQHEYALFKAALLAELCPSVDQAEVRAAVGRTQLHGMTRVRTRAYRALRLLRTDFYASHKVVPRWLVGRMNARMLAVWFMDDGYMRVRPGRQPRAEIATCGFAPRDLECLVEALAVFGLSTRCIRGRIVFSAAETRWLCEAIAPYLPPSMRYKLPAEVALRVPFNPDSYRPGAAEVMYDVAEVEDITDKARTDTTFFCIDVDETHNFVTAGGVVHNCRPPGNRDPEPDEIAACRPYLERQIELVAPKVIVSLGNFATKLLLDTREGITKVRGKAYPFRTGVLIPTYHPAAVLRGGGEPLAQMRADFIRAKQALAAARKSS